jgi:hypothetical protein
MAVIVARSTALSECGRKLIVRETEVQAIALICLVNLFIKSVMSRPRSLLCLISGVRGRPDTAVGPDHGRVTDSETNVIDLVGSAMAFLVFLMVVAAHL